MVYAVIDTNVIVAAAKSHKPDSSTSRVLSLVFSGVIQPLVCDEILDEYESELAESSPEPFHCPQRRDKYHNRQCG